MNPRERIGFAELPASRRVGSPLLAAGLASIKIKFLFGDRRFLAAGCEELQFNPHFYILMTLFLPVMKIIGIQSLRDC